MYRFFLSVVVLFFAINAGAADIPPLINYQGMLTDAQGQPLPNGTHKLTFNLYNTATGDDNNLIWGPQVFQTVPVINGYFNVILGPVETDAAGSPLVDGDSILDAFDTEGRYLGIRMDDGEEITPRQQILSTPYAIKAMDTDTLGKGAILLNDDKIHVNAEQVTFSDGQQFIDFMSEPNTSPYGLSISASDRGVLFENNSTNRGYAFSNSNGELLSISKGGSILSLRVGEGKSTINGIIAGSILLSYNGSATSTGNGFTITNSEYADQTSCVIVNFNSAFANTPHIIVQKNSSHMNDWQWFPGAYAANINNFQLCATYSAGSWSSSIRKIGFSFMAIGY